VRIKYPNSDNALKDLWSTILFVKRRFTDCMRRSHDAVAVLYISSLMISPKVICEGRQLVDELRDLASLSPRSSICVIRTTAPSYFRGNMKKLQETSIDSLRDSCYVVVYDGRREFLNHAKFLIFYLVCFSEGAVYHGKYYGSTNLTAAGLARPRNSRGNYEEFTLVRPRRKPLDRRDIFYLGEILDQVTRKVNLFTNPDYLRSFLKDHLDWLEEVLRRARKVVSGTTLGELYEAYVDLMIAHYQTCALLDELPGKLLTEKLVGALTEVGPPADPFELEMMMPTGVEDAELLAERLGFSTTDLRELVTGYISIVDRARELIEARYLPELRRVERYFDDRERRFFGLVKENGKYHMDVLEELLGKAAVG